MIGAFGLSADDADEAALKHQLAAQAALVVGSVAEEKFGLRARHQALAPEEISLVITDAPKTRRIAAPEVGGDPCLGCARRGAGWRQCLF